MEEKSNKGFSCGWGGDKRSGGWGQARKDGEAELPMVKQSSQDRARKWMG